MLLEKLKYFLLDRQFTLLTDAKALVYLRNAPSSNSKLMRWCLRLAEFDFTPHHVKGTHFTVPDYLSRYIDCVEGLKGSDPCEREVPDPN